MIAAGRSPKAARQRASPTPAVASSSSRASWASRRPFAERQCRMAGLPGVEREREVPPQVRQLVRDRAEDAVVVEAGLADGDDPLDPPASSTIRSQPASSTLAASCGWTPTPTSSPSNRSARASARSLEATFQPGTRIRSTPARRAPPRTRSASPSNRSALRWQWLSTRRGTAVTPGAGSAGVRPRAPGAGRAARARSPGPASAAWAPQASSSRIGGPPLPSASYGKA